MKYSILLPIGVNRPEQAVTFANLVQWTRADRLWQGQTILLDNHHLAAWLAGIGIRVPCGFGVSLMPMRSPYQAAVEARSVALATGHSVIAGFGPGAIEAQMGFLGRRYASQIGACREYLQIVRGLLNGEVVEVRGRDYSATAKLIDTLSPPVYLGLGVLRERMAELAGEVADSAITWLAPAAYVGGTLIPAIRKAKRDLPDPVRVTAIVPVALSGPDRDVLRLATATCGQHIRLPHYRDALRRAGISVDGDDAIGRLIDGGVFLYGTAREIHERLREFAAAGVDEVVLNTIGVAQVHGAKAAARDLLELLKTVPDEGEAAFEETGNGMPAAAPGGHQG